MVHVCVAMFFVCRKRPFCRVTNMSRPNAPDRLVVYGSLAPGRSNHHHLADIRGVWREGWVEGVLCDRGWGAARGFPGIRPERGGPRVDVHVFESSELGSLYDPYALIFQTFPGSRRRHLS